MFHDNKNVMFKFYLKPFFHSGVNKCSKNNGGCSDLCLALPNDNYVCACPEGKELVDKICHSKNNFYIYSFNLNYLKQLMNIKNPLKNW